MKIPSRLFRLELNKNQRLKVYDLILFNAAGEGGLCMDFNTSLNSDPQLSWAVWSDTLSVVFSAQLMYSGERADNPNYWKPYNIIIRHLIGSLILGVNKRNET